MLLKAWLRCRIGLSRTDWMKLVSENFHSRLIANDIERIVSHMRVRKLTTAVVTVWEQGWPPARARQAIRGYY